MTHSPAPKDMGGAEGGGITSPEMGSMSPRGSTHPSGFTRSNWVQIQWVWVGVEYGPTSHPSVSQLYKKHNSKLH